MSLEEITELIDSKIEKDPNCIIFTWFEIRVRKNLTEEQTDEFLRLARNRLERSANHDGLSTRSITDQG